MPVKRKTAEPLPKPTLFDTHTFKHKYINHNPDTFRMKTGTHNAHKNKNQTKFFKTSMFDPWGWLNTLFSTPGCPYTNRFSEKNLQTLDFFGKVCFTKNCFSRVVGCFWLPGPWNSSPGWSSSHVGNRRAPGDDF